MMIAFLGQNGSVGLQQVSNSMLKSQVQYLACNMKLENEKYFENSRAGSSGAIISAFL